MIKKRYSKTMLRQLMLWRFLLSESRFGFSGGK